MQQQQNETVAYKIKELISSITIQAYTKHLAEITINGLVYRHKNSTGYKLPNNLIMSTLWQ